MYGWRGRIGSISATPSEAFPYEFYLMAPAGVSLVPACMFVHNVTFDELAQGEATLDRTAQELAQEGVDIIVLGGAPALYAHPPGYDHEVAQRIESLTGVPTISNHTAAMEALRELGAKRLAVASPYSVEIAHKLDGLLAEEGFQVLSHRNLDVRHNRDIARLPPHASYQLARDAFLAAKNAEALYITCANWVVAPNIAPLERDLGVPVIASNQTKLWSAFRRLHIREPISGYGRILETL